MFRISLIGLLCAIVSTASASAQDKAKVPTGPSPRFATVTALDKAKGVIELTEVQTKFAGFQVLFSEVLENGVTVLKHKTIYKPVTEQVHKQLAVDTAAVFDTAGKKLSRDEVWQRVRVGATVLVSADGKQVDPAYLRAAARDILIMVSLPYVQPTGNEPPVPGLVPAKP